MCGLEINRMLDQHRRYGRMLVMGLESSQSCLAVGMRRAAPSFLLSALRKLIAGMEYSACMRLEVNKTKSLMNILMILHLRCIRATCILRSRFKGVYSKLTKRDSRKKEYTHKRFVTVCRVTAAALNVEVPRFIMCKLWDGLQTSNKLFPSAAKAPAFNRLVARWIDNLIILNVCRWPGVSFRCVSSRCGITFFRNVRGTVLM